MTENRLDRGGKQAFPAIDMVAVVIAFLGAIASVAGSVAVYVSQRQFAATSLWPLPGLVLLLWALLGVFGLLAATMSLLDASSWWLKVLLFLTGAFIPLIIIGALSIGSLVMIGFLFFIVSGVILAIRRKAKFLESFGLFMLGAFATLGLLYAIITLGGSSL